jgi:hypothetical protein
LNASVAGDDNVFWLNTTSLRAFHMVHIAPAQTNSVTACFFPLHLSTISLSRESQQIGEISQPKLSLRKDQRNIAMGHWNMNMIWSEVSNLPHTKHSSCPDHFFFFSWTAHCIRSLWGYRPVYSHGSTWAASDKVAQFAR